MKAPNFDELVSIFYTDPVFNDLVLEWDRQKVVSKEWLDKMIARTFILLREYYKKFGIEESEKATMAEVEKIVYESFVGAPTTSH
jgi:sporulation-control protein spo0M